jgi:glycosyltransferase involved in cell wall biosynthesis
MALRGWPRLGQNLMVEDIVKTARVAVVVPIFRHSVLLSEAVDSVLAQKADFGIKLVLVNDGCPHAETDAVCLDYARAYPDQVVYLRKANGGLSDARNHGIRYVLDHAPGVKAVYLLDADNRLRAHSLSRAMAVLDENPTLGWVYPNIDMFGLQSAHDYGGTYSRLIHSHMNICEAGSLISRQVFEAGVMFDTDFKQGFEDWEFFLAAGGAGFRGKNLESFGFQYRKRPESMLADAEREGSGIKSAMVLKHKAFLQPKSLIELEQVEAPRYAILIADENKVVLTTDPTLAGEEITLKEYEYRMWRGYANPSQFGFSPLLVVMSADVAAQLTQIGMLHWTLWRMEAMAESAGIALLHLEGRDDDRIAINVATHADPRVLAASILMIRPQLLRSVLFDESSNWIDTLTSATPQPPLHLLGLTIPTATIDPMRHIGRQAAFDFLSLVHRLKLSHWRAGAMSVSDWRKGDIQIRAKSHEVLRKKLGGAPAYPRVADGRKHIGLSIPIVEFGGVEKVALNYARELKAAGFGVHLFVLMDQGSAISKEWRDVLDSVNFLSGTGFNTWGGGERSFLGTELPGWAVQGNHSMALGLMYWLDTVIDFHGGAGVAIMGKLKKLGVRTVTSLHLADLSAGQRPIGNPYLALAYEHAFDVFAPCSLQLGDWLHGMGVPLDKIKPVVNAPSFPIADDTRAACLAERQTRSPDAPLRVMYLGRLDPQKGLEPLSQVVEASAILNVAWRIIGKAVVTDVAQPISPAIQRVLEPSLSTPEELIDAYAWADVVVLLSSYEGLPLTILEAMRQGVVCIATDVGAVTEALEDDVNGVVLPLSEAAEGCLAALTRLSVDRAALRRLSMRAAADMDGRDWAAAMAGLSGLLAPPQKIKKVGDV